MRDIFICSKTDDISVKEMLKKMPDDENVKKTSMRLQMHLLLASKGWNKRPYYDLTHHGA